MDDDRKSGPDQQGSNRLDGLRIDPRLLEILVCPLTRSTLKYDAERQELISTNAKLAFSIKDGIPIMLVDDARKLS